MVNNIPLNGWPQLKDLEAVQPTLDRLDKIEAWKRTVKEETFTGDDITIENALALPARSLITSIEPIQDLHGYDKPWAGGAGKNKFDNSYPDITTEVKYRAINVGDGTFTMSTVDVSGSSSFSLIFFLAGNVSSGASSANNGVYPNRPITVTAVDGYVTVGYRTGDEAEQTPVGKQTQIESGSSATTYAPYSNICPISGRDSVVLTRSDGDETSEDFTIQLGQTVYGGTVNLVMGAAVVDRAIVTLDGSESWQVETTLVSGLYRYSLVNGIDNLKPPVNNNTPLACISNAYVGVTANETYAATKYGISNLGLNSNRIVVLDPNINGSTTTAWTTHLSSNPLQMCYELATPIELTLTPTEVQMLKGYNRVTLSDGYGTIELKALTGANWS